MSYTEEYYKTNNYINYLERKDRYYHLAKELDSLFGILSISKKSKILDYGCALGFLMSGFEKLGYNNIFGYDISEYCKEYCLTNRIKFLHAPDTYYDILICLDVLEHMSNTEVHKLLSFVTSKILIGRIPVSKDKNGSFYLDISRKDTTHINCKTKDEWKDILYQYGFSTIFHLNMNSIYDSDGVFSFVALKDKLNV